jgi:hypothetical protein
MNPRNAINFFRTPTGAFIAFAVILVVAFIVVKGFYDPNKGKPRPSAAIVGDKSVTKPQLVQTVERALVPFNPPASSDARMPPRTDNSTQNQRPLFTPISLYPDTSSNEQKPLSKFYAPYGRLIPCELIVTIDSSSIQTPIIGLVTEDIYHDGRLIITAGTEVHGTAQADRKRERIASNGEWTLVWQTGEEMRLSGIALDREKDPNGTGWGITDGSAGLRGQVLKTDNLAEIKLFAATFLSGAASALTQTRQTIVGTELLPTLQNAPLQGAQNVLATYAQQILDTIQRDGFYVRVPAGKEFYLYVMQTIDKSDATVGGTRLSPTVETNETPTRASLLQFHRENP